MKHTALIGFVKQRVWYSTQICFALAESASLQLEGVIARSSFVHLLIIVENQLGQSHRVLLPTAIPF
jgi:hypothetical protein